MKNIKMIALILLSAILLLSSAACNPSDGGNDDAATGKPIAGLPDKLSDPNLKIFLWQPPEGKILEKIFKEFEKKYGGKVDYSVCPWDELNAKYVTTMAANEGPDVIWNQEGWFMHYISGDLLMPVDDYIDLNDPIFDKAVCDVFTWKEKHYLPMGKGMSTGRYVFFNQTLFEAAGAKTPLEYYEEGNWNWETFVKAGKELTADTDGDGKTDQWGWASWMMPIFTSANGGGLVEFGANASVKTTIESEKATRAMQFLKDGYSKDAFMMPDGNMMYQTAFQTGKAAMITEGEWMADTVIKQSGMKDEWDVVPFPLGPDNTEKKNPCSAATWTLAKGAKNPKGGAAFCYMYTTHMQANGNDDLKLYFTDAQIERVLAARENPITNLFEPGFGNWERLQWSFWFEIVGEESVSTVVAKYKPLLERSIRDTLNK